MKKICFAISFHENKEVIKDLLDNIRFFCPNSSIVLFRSGEDPNLFDGLSYPICPTSKSLTYGSGLIWFHLNVMEWLEKINLEYDYLINLDSDNLFAKKGFEEFVSSEMNGYDYMATHKRIPEPEWYPGLFMKRVWSTWQPIFNTADFVGCFNPGQIFSRNFVKKILNYSKLGQIKKAIEETETFAVEEIIFPTLAETLGVKAKAYPDKVQDWIRYRPHFSANEIQHGIDSDMDCYLIHPIHRDMNDDARTYIRNLTKKS